jgi:predicted DsbA family dithiol-disulfide isomerase
MGTMRPIRIDVFGDIACPWCYIGEVRLAGALAEQSEQSAERCWRPFQLQPQLPPEGIDWHEFARAKFGGEERAQAVFAQVAEVGARDSLEFRFDRVARAPNTRDAHRLILFAGRSGLQHEAAMAVFRAYFTEGRDPGEQRVLLAVGREIGLDADALDAYLRSAEGIDAVLESQAEARRLGVTGVPFYIFDGRYAISGAQPQEIFRQAIEQARALARPGPHI